MNILIFYKIIKSISSQIKINKYQIKNNIKNEN